MRTITLFPPEVKESKATFRWQVDPPATLYHNPQFTMRFPASVDLSRVPEGLWWTIMLICLHSQWPLLRPCRVRLPVRLQPGEAECWSRLTDAEIATLEVYRGTSDFERKIEIVEEGPPLAYSVPDSGGDTNGDSASAARAERCATAFSGGKDSLVQTGILTELTEKPVLVATTSQMPGLQEHLTQRRRYVLDEIQRRRDVTLIEVESDYRAIFDHGFAQEQGYWMSVNELTDTLIYASSLLAAGVAAGATHLYHASEAQVQESVERDGRVIQHKHYMYSAITQGAIDAILRPFGLSHGSLISSLHSFQVQELLWTRYSDLSDLQYSCWRTRIGEMMCNKCSQCLRVALCAFALGKEATRMGVDWATLLYETREWRPKILDKSLEESLPTDIVSYQLHSQVVRDLRTISWRNMARAIMNDRPFAMLRPQGWMAIAAFRRLQRETTPRELGPRPGYRPGYLKLIDPLLTDSIARIYNEHFDPADESSYAGVLSRSEAMINWITEPLNG